MSKFDYTHPINFTKSGKRKKSSLVHEMLHQGLTPEEVAIKLDISLENVKQLNIYHESKIKELFNDGEIKEDTIVNLNTLDADEMIKPKSWREILDSAVIIAKERGLLKPKKNEISHMINSDQPILIVNSADWHFGAPYVDLRSLKEHLDLILNHPNIYVFVVGDMIQNMSPISRKPSSTISLQVLQNKDQVKFMMSILEELTARKKLLACVWGNHDDEFDERTIGYSVKELVMSDKNVYLPNGGFVNIILNDDITYRFHLAHTYKGYSMYNPNHSNQRAYREKAILPLSPDSLYLEGVDAIIQGHKHTPAVQFYPINGRHVHLIQTGTFQLGGAYGERYFPTVDNMMFPTMILNPNKRQMEVFSSLKSALELLNLK